MNGGFVMIYFLIALLILVFLAIGLFVLMHFISRKPQHSIIRSHPFLGWLRYFIEKLGPEFRQYWFDGDRSGKPFSRYEFIGLVFSAKYRTDILGFGSKQDFQE